MLLIGARPQRDRLQEDLTDLGWVGGDEVPPPVASVIFCNSFWLTSVPMPIAMTWTGFAGFSIDFSWLIRVVESHATRVVVLAVGHDDDRVHAARIPVLLDRLVRSEHGVVEPGIAVGHRLDVGKLRQHLGATVRERLDRHQLR